MTKNIFRLLPLVAVFSLSQACELPVTEKDKCKDVPKSFWDELHCNSDSVKPGFEEEVGANYDCCLSIRTDRCGMNEYNSEILKCTDVFENFKPEALACDMDKTKHAYCYITSDYETEGGCKDGFVREGERCKRPSQGNNQNEESDEQENNQNGGQGDQGNTNNENGNHSEEDENNKITDQKTCDSQADMFWDFENCNAIDNSGKECCIKMSINQCGVNKMNDEGANIGKYVDCTQVYAHYKTELINCTKETNRQPTCELLKPEDGRDYCESGYHFDNNKCVEGESSEGSLENCGGMDCFKLYRGYTANALTCIKSTCGKKDDLSKVESPCTKGYQLSDNYKICEWIGNNDTNKSCGPDKLDCTSESVFKDENALTVGCYKGKCVSLMCKLAKPVQGMGDNIRCNEELCSRVDSIKCEGQAYSGNVYYAHVQFWTGKQILDLEAQNETGKTMDEYKCTEPSDTLFCNQKLNVEMSTENFEICESKQKCFRLPPLYSNCKSESEAMTSTKCVMNYHCWGSKDGDSCDAANSLIH